MHSLGSFTARGTCLASLGVPILFLLDVLALREEELSFSGFQEQPSMRLQVKV